MHHPSAPHALLWATPDHMVTSNALAELLHARDWQARLHRIEPTWGRDDMAMAVGGITANSPPPSLVVVAAGHWAAGSALNTTTTDWAQAWHLQCAPAWCATQAAIRRMAGAHGPSRWVRRAPPPARGTIVLLGHPDGITDAQPARHRAPHTFSAPHAAASAGLRAMAQAFARACGPQGIHVAHVVTSASPEATAQACWMLHQQAPSAWAHELDLRTHG